MEEMIKFKMTSGQQEEIQLAYEPAKTVSQYIDNLAELFDSSPEDFKLVFKGKILKYKETAEGAKIKAGTVMVVLNNAKKPTKKVVSSKQQVVPGAGMSTGLGASSPFGVGGYQVVNHPQYMSAISSAVDPDKMEEILEDPQYQGMMEQLLQDPDTLRQLINENPMLSKMMKDNPSMKMILQNPALMKMVFNKEMIKKTQEFMKNGGNINDPAEAAQKMGLGTTPMMNPLANMEPNPFLSLNQNMPSNQNSSQSGQQNLLQMQIEKQFFARLYQNQLKELVEYGFKDEDKNIKALRESKGNVQEAMEKLCSQ